MGAEVAKVERADLGRDQKPAENVESAKMAWYKQILLAVAISVLMIPAILWSVHAQYNLDLYAQTDFKLEPKQTAPEVYKGKIDLKTGNVRIVKY